MTMDERIETDGRTDGLVFCPYHPNTPLDGAGECGQCEADIMEYSRWIKNPKPDYIPDIVQRGLNNGHATI